jgi:hypothetical protein
MRCPDDLRAKVRAPRKTIRACYIFEIEYRGQGEAAPHPHDHAAGRPESVAEVPADDR